MRVALAILFLVLASVPASAGRGWGGPVVIHKHHNDVGAGILGGIVGGVVGSFLTRPAPPPPVVVVPQRRDDDLEPWSKAWYVYCSRKFKSFDPETGTFTGYDGVKKFCR